jgi:arylsulfatase A-like enzyme
MTKETLKLTGIAASLLLANGVNAEAQKEQKPNIVFVFADQLRHDRLGYAGDTRAYTPNIDRLAAQSMNFRNAVAVSPVSAPMRASLFTGKYSSSTGMVINELRINPDHRTIAHVLGENHYSTAYIGKWHLWSNLAGYHDSIAYAYTPPGPYRLGFDQEWKAYNFHHRNYNSYYFENKAEKIFYGDSVYEPEAQFNMAIDFVESAKNKNEPFALFLSIGVPHDPWTKDNVPEKWYHFYKDTVFGYPQTWSDTPDRYMDRYKDPARWLNYYKKNLPEFQRVYYAMTASFDEGMGRLLNKLKELGLDENTIVVVTSDHGEMFGEHGRIQKMIFYDPAARVPFLIRWPGHVPAGAVSDACLNTPDIMPTLLGMAKLPIPREVEGMDLGGIALGKAGPEPEMAFLQGMGHTYLWEDGSEWRAVRGKQYTYATYRVDGSELLFDNINDPSQAHNLASDPGYQKIKGQMKSFMKTKMADLKDDFQPCTWYRDHWTDGNRNITSAAKGPFKTIPVSKE